MLISLPPHLKRYIAPNVSKNKVGKGNEYSPSHRLEQVVETKLDIWSEQNIGSTCALFSFDDEPIVYFETPSHSVGIAW